MIRVFCWSRLSVISMLVLSAFVLGVMSPLRAQNIPLQFQLILSPEQGAASGLREIWQLPLVINSDRNQIVAVTPLNDAVYVLTNQGYLISIDATAGTTRWKIQLPGNGNNTFRPTNYAPNQILIVSQGEIMIIDSRSGKILESASLNFAPATNPLVGDDHIFLGGLNDSMYALSTEFPISNVWFQLSVGDSFTSDPVLIQDTLVFASRSGTLWGKPADDGQGGWNRQLGSSVIASPAASDEYVYYPCTDGKVYSVEAATGIVPWATRLPGKLNLQPVVTEDEVLVPTGGEGLFCLDADNGNITWGPVSQVDGIAAIIGSTIYGATTNNCIKVINVKQGIVTATAQLQGKIIFAPNTSGTIIYLASEDGRVAALTPNAQ